MTRVRLPDRRAAETVELEHGGQRFTVTVGFYPDGRPGEVFTHGARSGSTQLSLAKEGQTAQTPPTSGHLGSVGLTLQSPPQPSHLQ